MGVPPEEVRRVASLARLDLREEEVATLTTELGRILGHVEALEDDERDRGREADAPDREAPDREEAGAEADLPGGDPLARPPSSFAPAFEDGFFTVPRLASHGGEADEGLARDVGEP